MYDDSIKIPRPLRIILSYNHSSLSQGWTFVLPGVILLFVCDTELIQGGGLEGQCSKEIIRRGREPEKLEQGSCNCQAAGLSDHPADRVSVR